MSKIWFFGDCFTVGHGCTKEYPYYQNYYNDGDKIWCEIISDKLNSQFQIVGKIDSSNEYIFENIVKLWDEFQPNDIIFIERTYSTFFDVPLENSFVTIMGSQRYKVPEVTDDEFKIINDYRTKFVNNKPLRERHKFYFDFLIKLLENKKIKTILWTIEDARTGFETIHKATNGEITDKHLSFKGHIEFANYMYTKHFKDKNNLI